MSARATLAAVAILVTSTGCSPLIGLVVRATEGGGGGGDIRVGESRSGSTRGASDTYTPACGAPDGGGDDAYTFVPDRSGTYRVDLNGGYDCVVAILDEAGESVACNDDTDGTSHSQVEARLEASRRYTIVVDGYRGATGSYTVRLDAIQLDDAAPPTPEGPVLVVGQERTGDTRAGTDSRTPPCGSTPGSPDDVWTFVPPEDAVYQIDVASDFDGTLALYAPNVAEPLACNDDEGTTRASRVTASLSAGTAYQVVVDGYHGSTGTYRIRVESAGASGVRPLSIGAPVRGDTRGQTDTRTPGCGSRPGSPDQVWTFTATQTGPVQLHVDAEYDSVLAVYEQGSSTPIDCNDDFQGTRMSRLTPQLVSGHTYEVVVDGYSGASGPYMLQATRITSAGGGPITLGQTVQGNTSAGADRRNPGCGSQPGSPDETWFFVAPNSAMYAFQVDADYDSVLALYAPNAPQPLACNDDHGSTRASRIESSLNAGQRVEIVVDGFSGQVGSYRLQVTQMSAGPPTLPTAPATIENITALEARCGNATPLTAGRHTAQILRATAHARTMCAGGGGGGEVLYAVQVQQPTVLHVTAEGAAGPVLELRTGCSRGHATVACDGSQPRAALQARLEPGRQYILVVDSRAAADAEVTIEAQLTGVPAP